MSQRSGRLAVLGDPLAFTRSPELHRAGLAALALDGDSEALRTPVASLGDRLRALAAAGYRGVNLTSPLKAAGLLHVARVSEAARRARSVNTIGFEPDGTWGDTTDGPGFVDLLRSLGRDPARERVVLLGAGGAARSLALALIAAGCPAVTASARRPDASRDDWQSLAPAEVVRWRSPEEAAIARRATVVVNATPLSGADGALDLEALGRRTLVIDLGYGERPTEWVRRARELGLEAYDGLGLLVFQARLSLALWYARPVPVDPLARAVGWPR
ncbi:MAG TPA: NAD(P)-binding domain-containing protein [Candidatus Limnocylindria bacterium]|nr:NAD(P)-binding domain-containing protein [Candidatus Limnocylindria bacterium]